MMIEPIRIHLAAIWIVVMLIYLLGDVIRIFVGDFKPGEIGGQPITQAMGLGIAVLMLMPILMVFLSLVLDAPINRTANIVVAIFFFVFNAIAVPGYPSAFDRFLLLVSLVFNGVTVWYAWNWI